MRHSKRWLTIKTRLTQALFIALIAILCMGVSNTIYDLLTHGKPINWGITGRWVVMLSHGVFFTPNVGLLPEQPHEWLYGFLAHDVTAWVFSGAYIIFCQSIIKRPSSLPNGLCFGWLLMAFPLFIQLPSMGQGVLALDALDPTATLLRTFRCHSFFGLGLGLGGIGYRYLNRLS